MKNEKDEIPNWNIPISNADWVLQPPFLLCDDVNVRVLFMYVREHRTLIRKQREQIPKELSTVYIEW